MADKVKRRLTTIMCADVKSYSSLMEKDETRTLRRLKDYRGSMFGFVERHDGRVVNTWGDAVIAEFSSVVESVQCAIEIQRELAARNQTLSEAEQMWFRIGINLGDVMVEGDDIYGEGVNVASRLQELADPGGITISSTTYDQVRNKLSIGFDFIGTPPMKNISEPIPSYRIMLDGYKAPNIRRSPTEKSTPYTNGPDSLLDAIPALPSEKQVSNWLAKGRNWYNSQSKTMRTAVNISGGLVALDLVTGGGVWFFWPVAVIMGIAWFRERGKSRK